MSITQIVQHFLCRYCGASVTRTLRKGDRPRAAVCDGPACRRRSREDAGRKGGQSERI